MNFRDEEQSESVRSFVRRSGCVANVRFHPVEGNLCASTAFNCSIVLNRVTLLGNVVLEMKTNRVAWNPQGSFTFPEFVLTGEKTAAMPHSVQRQMYSHQALEEGAVLFCT